MGGHDFKIVSVRGTLTGFATIQSAAAIQKMSASKFIWHAALDKANVRPFFSREDRFLLLYLRNELREEGLLLTDWLRTVNVEGIPVEDSLKLSVLNMQRAISAICIELNTYTKSLL